MLSIGHRGFVLHYGITSGAILDVGRDHVLVLRAAVAEDWPIRCRRHNKSRAVFAHPTNVIAKICEIANPLKPQGRISQL
jgi:hypothetical protein